MSDETAGCVPGPTTLREAAVLMRFEHGPEQERHAMWAAMADLIENAKCGLHCGPSGLREPYCSACEDSTYDHDCPPTRPCEHTASYRRALAVASAYLEATTRVTTPGPTPGGASK